MSNVIQNTSGLYSPNKGGNIILRLLKMAIDTKGTQVTGRRAWNSGWYDFKVQVLSLSSRVWESLLTVPSQRACGIYTVSHLSMVQKQLESC